MDKLAIIDADTFIYIASYNKKDEPERTIQEMFDICDGLLETCINRTKADAYVGFITTGSFRYKIGKVKDYKGQRQDIVKPRCYNLLKGYLEDVLGFRSLYNHEADDLCIMTQNSLRSEYKCVICSPDKDLRQVQGDFYDYKKDELFSLTKEEADRNLWLQVLTGDGCDNIPGCKGIGKVKADRILSANGEYKNNVLDCYVKTYGQYQGILNFTENYRLCKMLELTLEGELYYPTNIRKIEAKSESVEIIW